MSATATALKAAATGQLAAKPERPKDLAHLMAMPAVREQIKAALPRHMTADRMARIAMTEMRKNPKLAQCEPMSFLGAVIQCSQIGLEPGSALGHAYILPYERRIKQGRDWVSRMEAQVIIGYRGMIDLARRSGQILSLQATAVYEGDDFECTLGLDPTLEHKPDLDNVDREQPERLTFVYAVAKLKDGGTQFAVMSRNQVRAIMERSQGYIYAAQKVAEGKKPDNPWFSDFEAMALKTVIRRLFKYLPVSVEIQQAVQLDERAEHGSQDNGFVIEGAVTEGLDDDEPANDAGNRAEGNTSAGAAGGQQQEGGAGGEGADFPLPTYAVLAERMKNTEDPQIADLILGDGESLTPDEQAELRKVYDAKFPTNSTAEPRRARGK